MSNIYFAGSGGGGLDPDDCTATPAQVLEGHTAGVNGNDDPVEGTMPYQKQEGTLNCGQSSIILPGYHDGTRSITANSLASQTPGTASAANIYPGKTARDYDHAGRRYIYRRNRRQNGGAREPVCDGECRGERGCEPDGGEY